MLHTFLVLISTNMNSIAQKHGKVNSTEWYCRKIGKIDNGGGVFLCIFNAYGI
jgi:hypothetical protein